MFGAFEKYRLSIDMIASSEVREIFAEMRSPPPRPATPVPPLHKPNISANVSANIAGLRLDDAQQEHRATAQDTADADEQEMGPHRRLHSQGAMGVLYLKNNAPVGLFEELVLVSPSVASTCARTAQDVALRGVFEELSDVADLTVSSPAEIRPRSAPDCDRLSVNVYRRTSQVSSGHSVITLIASVERSSDVMSTVFQVLTALDVQA